MSSAASLVSPPPPPTNTLVSPPRPARVKKHHAGNNEVEANGSNQQQQQVDHPKRNSGSSNQPPPISQSAMNGINAAVSSSSSSSITPSSPIVAHPQAPARRTRVDKGSFQARSIANTLQSAAATVVPSPSSSSSSSSASSTPAQPNQHSKQSQQQQQGKGAKVANATSPSNAPSNGHKQQQQQQPHHHQHGHSQGQVQGQQQQQQSHRGSANGGQPGSKPRRSGGHGRQLHGNAHQHHTHPGGHASPPSIVISPTPSPRHQQHHQQHQPHHHQQQQPQHPSPHYQQHSFPHHQQQQHQQHAHQQQHHHQQQQQQVINPNQYQLPPSQYHHQANHLSHANHSMNNKSSVPLLRNPTSASTSSSSSASSSFSKPPLAGSPPASSPSSRTRPSIPLYNVRSAVNRQTSHSSNISSPSSSLHSSRVHTPCYTTPSSPDDSAQASPTGTHSTQRQQFTRSAPASPTANRATRQALLALQDDKSQHERDESLHSPEPDDEHEHHPFAPLKRASSSPAMSRCVRSASPLGSTHAQTHSLGSSFDRRRRTRAQDDVNHHHHHSRHHHHDANGDDMEEEHDDIDEGNISEHEEHRRSSTREPLEDDIESVCSNIDSANGREVSYAGSVSEDHIHSRSAELSDLDGEIEVQLQRPPQSTPPRVVKKNKREKKLHAAAAAQQHHQHQRHPHDEHLPNTASSISTTSSSSLPRSFSSNTSLPLSSSSTPSASPPAVMPFSNLHLQILEISTMMGPKPEAARIRSILSKRISEKVWELWPDAEVHIIGSCATNLFLPDSDIDLVVRNSHGKPKLETTDLFVLGEHLASLSSNINIISTASVPLIKLNITWPMTSPTPSSSSSASSSRPAPASTTSKLQLNFTVDLTLNVETGLYSTSFVLQQLDIYPDVLHRLTIVLKQFLKAKGLNDLYSGGLPSYTLILMIVSFLQHHPQEQERQMSRKSSIDESEKRPLLGTHPSTLQSLVTSASSASTLLPSSAIQAAAVAEYSDWPGDSQLHAQHSAPLLPSPTSTHQPLNIPLRTQLKKGGLSPGELLISNGSTPASSDGTPVSPARTINGVHPSSTSSTGAATTTQTPFDTSNIDLGEYLLAFLKLYSQTFNYDTMGISLVSGYFLKSSRGWLHSHNPGLLCLENPMDPSIDLGFKVFNYSAIKSAFFEAYERLKTGKGLGGGQQEEPPAAAAAAAVEKSPTPILASTSFSSDKPLLPMTVAHSHVASPFMNNVAGVATYTPSSGPHSASQSPFIGHTHHLAMSMPHLSLHHQSQHNHIQHQHAISPHFYPNVNNPNPRLSPGFELDSSIQCSSAPPLLPFPSNAVAVNNYAPQSNVGNYMPYQTTIMHAPTPYLHTGVIRHNGIQQQQQQQQHGKSHVSQQVHHKQHQQATNGKIQS